MVGDAVGDDYAEDGPYHRRMTKMMILVIVTMVIWLVMPMVLGTLPILTYTRSS